MTTFNILGLLRVLLLFWILGYFNATGDFYHDVNNWKTAYSRSNYCAGHAQQNSPHTCDTQLKGAKEKGKYVSSDSYTKAAVEIVYIYTWENPNSYQNANALMRGESNGYLANTGNVNMFNTYINLMKKSYDRLCAVFSNYCNYNDKVFRGQTYIPPEIGSTFTFQSFLSTSKSMTTAQNFAKGQMIFTIKGVSGLDLDLFSAVDGETEVLVKPQLKISVEINLKNSQSEIQKYIDQYDGNYYYPNSYVEGTVITSGSGRSNESKWHGAYIFPLLSFVVVCIANI